MIKTIFETIKLGVVEPTVENDLRVDIINHRHIILLLSIPLWKWYVPFMQQMLEEMAKEVGTDYKTLIEVLINENCYQPIFHIDDPSKEIFGTTSESIR